MDISEPTLDRARGYLSVVTSCYEASSVKNKTAEEVIFGRLAVRAEPDP
jgi:hypothetical protein